VIGYLKSTVRALAGSPTVWRNQRAALRRAALPRIGLDALRARAAEDVCPEALAAAETDDPVFVFSAGWRTGSTLVQRLINSGGDVLVWGESYDLCGLVQALTASVAPFSDAWPPQDYLEQPESREALPETWTANLYPPLPALRRAHRALFLELFAEPARKLGAPRWGFKEVRLGYDAALYLNWLFPKARFVYVTRDPVDAYRSYKTLTRGPRWYAHWPDRPAFTPYAFGRHIGELAAEFPAAAARTGGFTINYGELRADPALIDALGAFCGVEADRGVMRQKIDGSGEEPARRLSEPVTALERFALEAGRRRGAAFARARMRDAGRG
jgi:hypothetical protein